MTWNFGLHGFIQGNAPFYLPLSQGYKERTKNVFCPYFLNNWVHYHWFLKRLCKQIDRGLSIDGKLTRIHLCYQGLSEQAYFLQPFVVDGWLPLWVELSKSGQTISRSITQSSKPGIKLVLQYFDSGLPSFLYRCMFFIFIIMCTDALIYMWLKWVFA